MLVAHPPQATHFFGLAVGVLDYPVSRNQLRGHSPGVGDGDGVSETKLIPQGIALLGHILWLGLDVELVIGHAPW